MYAIQDYTCYHQWTAKTLDIRAQPVERIHMGTYLIQSEGNAAACYVLISL